MNISNLQANKDKLFAYLAEHLYSKDYTKKVKSAVNKVIQLGPSVDSYETIFAQLSKGRKTVKTVRECGLILGMIKRFDENGEYPSREVHHPFLTKKDEVVELSEEFSAIISYFERNAATRLGAKKERIVGVRNTAVSFFLHLQSKGLTNLHDATVIDVASFFSDGTKRIRGRSHKNQIRTIMRCTPDSLHEDALSIMDKIPYIPRTYSNYNYLREDEAKKVCKALIDKSNGLSLLNRAIAAVSFFYGMRGTDITSLEMENIDFENDLIKLVQSKTGTPLELPLSSVVGNAIYEYIMNERPKSEYKTIFVHKDYPHHKFGKITYHIKAVCKAAGVRMAENGVGTRLFRHHIATFLLSKNVSQPVISSLLGHLQPQTLNHYVDSDIEHLREFALDISPYPINKNILRLWH